MESLTQQLEGVSAAFSEVCGIGCCVCFGGELPFVWFPVPLPKLVSLTVKTLPRD